MHTFLATQSVIFPCAVDGHRTPQRTKSKADVLTAAAVNSFYNDLAWSFLGRFILPLISPGSQLAILRSKTKYEIILVRGPRQRLSQDSLLRAAIVNRTKYC